MKERHMTPDQLSVASIEYSKKLTSLQKLFATGSLETIKEFINSEASNIRLPNGMTYLHYAAENPDPRVIFYFIEEQGIDPNARMINGITPILLAAGCKNILGVTSLLTKGADPFKKTPLGRDVLSLMESRGVDDRTLKSVAALIAQREKMLSPSPGRSSFAMYGESRSSKGHSSDETQDDLPSTPLLNSGYSKQKKE